MLPVSRGAKPTAIPRFHPAWLFSGLWNHFLVFQIRLVSTEGQFFAVMIWCFFKPEAGTALRCSAVLSEC